MNKPLRVLLVDDHALVRAGIRTLLDAMPGVTVVAEAGDGAEALAQAAACRPDVVLTDIAMGNFSGLRLLAELRQSAPAVRTLILSMHDDIEYVQEALKCGAAGYLLKDAAKVELELALRAVAGGGTYLSPAIARKVSGEYVALLESAPSGLDPLTARQREILRRIAEGQSTKEIAFQLQLSIKTVETHRAQIMRRLDIHDVPGLVRFAVRTGLVSADS